jgi:hypothetical protein
MHSAHAFPAPAFSISRSLFRFQHRFGLASQAGDMPQEHRHLVLSSCSSKCRLRSSAPATTASWATSPVRVRPTRTSRLSLGLTTLETGLRETGPASARLICPWPRHAHGRMAPPLLAPGRPGCRRRRYPQKSAPARGKISSCFATGTAAPAALRVVPNPRVAQFARVESIGWTLPIDDISFRIYVAGRVKNSGDIGRMRSKFNGKF